jgi:hypothetical protein
MMIGDNGPEVIGQFPIPYEMSSCLTVIESEPLALRVEVLPAAKQLII